MQVRFRGGYDDVAVRSASREHIAIGIRNANRNLAQGINAARDALHGELSQVVLNVHDVVDGLVDSVHRTRADGACNMLHTVRIGVRG